MGLKWPCTSALPSGGTERHCPRTRSGHVGWNQAPPPAPRARPRVGLGVGGAEPAETVSPAPSAGQAACAQAWGRLAEELRPSVTPR